MMVSDAIKDAIAEVVRNRFGGAKITSINVTGAEDSDGDPIFKILIVFETAPGKETLDGQEMSGLVRHLMGRFAEMDVGEFPLVSFVSKNDAAKLNLEAA